MEMVFVIVAAAVVGFVSGVLVYRNNAKQAEEKAAEMREKYEGLVKKIEEKVKR